MTHKAKMMVSVLALVVAAGAAFAQEAPKAAPGKGHGKPEFTQLDTNADGKVTKEEMQAYRDGQKAEMIKSIDANGDGMITLDEMKAAMAAKAPEDKRERAEAKAEEHFKKLDTQGIGQVSVDDFLAAKAAGKGDGKGKRGDMFDRLDSDKDGVLSAEEYAKAGEEHGRKGGKHEGKHSRKDKPMNAPVEAQPAQ